MINKENNYIYKIPEKIKQLIKIEFMFVFKNELDKYFENENYKHIATYNNFYLYIEGTDGWEQSFKIACEQTELNKVLEFYFSLERNDRDFFDDELCMMMIKEKLMNVDKSLDL